MTATPFNLEETDRLLTTTRAVRKRLDLERPVEREVLLDCVRIAQQAPTGSNTQTWRWVFVTDAGRKQALAEIYRRAIGWEPGRRRAEDDNSTTGRILRSSDHLAANLDRVPVLAVPCIDWEIPDEQTHELWAGMFGSVVPSVWNFQLALRSRGLGSCYTTLHLRYVDEAAEILGLSEPTHQVALLPVAYTIGTDFRLAERPPPESIVTWL